MQWEWSAWMRDETMHTDHDGFVTAVQILEFMSGVFD